MIHGNARLTLQTRFELVLRHHRPHGGIGGAVPASRLVNKFPGNYS